MVDKLRQLEKEVKSLEREKKKLKEYKKELISYNKIIAFKISGKEKFLIEKVALKRGITLSEFARHCVLREINKKNGRSI